MGENGALTNERYFMVIVTLTRLVDDKFSSVRTTNTHFDKTFG